MSNQGMAFGAKVVKDVKLDNSAKEGLINGINKLADAVGSSLGAGGRTVIIEDDFGGAHITKDGVTISESIIVQDPIENLGVTMLKQAAKQTATKAGDGTTTSTVLAQYFIKEFVKANSNHSFRDLRNGAEKLQDAVLKELDERSIKVDNDTLKHVSIISTNNDEKLGGLIAEAFTEAGEDGVVTMAQSQTGSTYVKNVKGTKINSTAVHNIFFTNQEREFAELDRPLVFLSSSEISTIPIIDSILEVAVRKNRSLILVSPTGNQVTSALASNKAKGNIKVLIVNPPSFGLKQSDILDDLALLTGAIKYDESLGDTIDLINPDMLGEADKVISDKDGTIFFVDNSFDAVQERVLNIKKELSEVEDGSPLKRHLQDRLALLQGGVSQIFVGADTKHDLKEKQDRVDDAINAVKAAKKSGIIPGGGSALHYLANTLEIEGNEGELEGAKILKETLYAPFNKILNNAGLDPMNKKFNIKKWGKGVDVLTGSVTDMIEAGIIDPTLVTKEALRNALSVALTILSTDAVISNVRLS